MIVIETRAGLKHFTKAVFIWSGHVASGWPTSFNTFVYNDPLNGVITFGHDDIDPEILTWFVPNGCVSMNTQTVQGPEEGHRELRELYGDRVIIWINPKEGMPIISNWSGSEFVLTCPTLKFPPFTGSTQKEFKEWATPLLEQISTGDPIVVPYLA